MIFKINSCARDCLRYCLGWGKEERFNRECPCKMLSSIKSLWYVLNNDQIIIISIWKFGSLGVSVFQVFSINLFQKMNPWTKEMTTRCVNRSEALWCTMEFGFVLMNLDNHKHQNNIRKVQWLKLFEPHYAVVNLTSYRVDLKKERRL